MRRKRKSSTFLLRLLTSRPFIIGLNSALMVLSTTIIIAVTKILLNQQQNLHQQALHEIIQGSEEIFIVFGVILEERDFLMEKIGLYPTFQTPKEDLTDEACHAYGFGLLIFSSLFVIPVDLIILLHGLFDVSKMDLYLYYFSTVSLALEVLILIKFTYRLMQIQFNWVAPEEYEALKQEESDE